MRILRNRRLAGSILVLGSFLVGAGCYNTPSLPSESAQSPAPLRMPPPEKEAECGSYEDSLTGGQVFSMYCSYCHNAPNLSERSYSQFRNVAAHMRVRANLTGKEYAKLQEFLRRWNDVPGPQGVPEPSPKHLIFSQPISELRPQPPAPPQPKQPEAALPKADGAAQ
jgi:hypothetical protein